METSALQTKSKKLIDLVPSIWYIVLFLLLAGGNLFSLNAHVWNAGHTVTTLLAVAFTGLLALQVRKKLWWIDFYLGIVFTFASFLVFLAVLSEYKEFPTGKESGAILLLVMGGFLCLTSLVLAICMVGRGICGATKK